MRIIKPSLALLALVAGLCLNGLAQTPAAATPDAGTVRSAIDLVRADLKNEKALIIAQNITFTEDESAEFWPLYNDYNAALGRLQDERFGLIKEYVAQHDTLTDAQATALAGRAFDFEAKRVELKRTWFKKFAKVIPAKQAALFFQIENQLNAALDLLMMDALPLIK